MKVWLVKAPLITRSVTRNCSGISNRFLLIIYIYRNGSDETKMECNESNSKMNNFGTNVENSFNVQLLEVTELYI